MGKQGLSVIDSFFLEYAESMHTVLFADLVLVWSYIAGAVTCMPNRASGQRFASDILDSRALASHAGVLHPVEIIAEEEALSHNTAVNKQDANIAGQESGTEKCLGLQEIWHKLYRERIEIGDGDSLHGRIAAFSVDNATAGLFSMPGHKGRLSPSIPGITKESDIARLDLTELPGLDDLSCPSGVLLDLEKEIACLRSAARSLICTSGASVALMASMLEVSAPGQHILLPRNAHRSVVHGLVIAGLEPLWYEPSFDTSWNLYGHVEPSVIEAELAKARERGLSVCAVLVVSPTYSGSISNIEEISAICRRSKVQLIVDEAHGAHLGLTPGSPSSACASGADLVVQSWFKTLGAITPCALVHLADTGSGVRSSQLELRAERLRRHLNLLSTSSPSYIALASFEQNLHILQSSQGVAILASVQNMAEDLVRFCRKKENSIFEIFESGYRHDSWHFVLRCRGIEAEELALRLHQQKIHSEGIIGQGILLLFGIGTTIEDCRELKQALEKISRDIRPDDRPSCKSRQPARLEQVVSPREAYCSDSESVLLEESLGRISSECYAPCPPGIPLVVPGCLIDQSVLDCLVSSEKRRIMVMHEA